MNTLDRDALALTPEQLEDLTVAERINHETRANPASPYTNKIIGVWHGEVVAVGETRDEVYDHLLALGDSDFQAIVREASADYDAPLRIGPLRGGR